VYVQFGVQKAKDFEWVAFGWWWLTVLTLNSFGQKQTFLRGVLIRLLTRAVAYLIKLVPSTTSVINN
jgi:hypothetical protein